MAVIPTHPIWLVRHGETEWNVAGRCQGHRDSDLTARGRAQAALVAAILEQAIAGLSNVRLVASPLGRTQMTAAIIAGRLGLPVETDPRLAEVSFGAWEGMTRREIEAANPWLAGYGPYGWQFLAPDGESAAQVLDRLTAWMATVDRPTIAVSHGMAGRLLRGWYSGLDLEASNALPAPQDRVFRLEAGRVAELEPA
ncbi:histidine phosphatase family protein [Oleisolibacter albus]|uniref:histidine phosphatase family protein n=1 Tax=Oleisolibacter albus TaxID=2171757 RepID=UPI000DF33B72|nr:histidine phosphatase family protein [Oleisolibacter albus]